MVCELGGSLPFVCWLLKQDCLFCLAWICSLIDGSFRRSLTWMLKFGKCGLSVLIAGGKRRKIPLHHAKVSIERSVLLEFCCRVANVSSWRDFNNLGLEGIVL